MKIGRIDRRRFAALSVFMLLATLFAAPASGAEMGRHADVKGIIKYNGAFVEEPATVWDIFDPWYYVTANDGMAASWHTAGSQAGEDAEALYSDFMENGIALGRSCSPYLNLAAYRRAYPDLNARFGDDWDSYVAYYFATGMNAGQTDGTDARDARIRQALVRLAAQGLRGEAFTARLLALYPDYNIVPPERHRSDEAGEAPEGSGTRATPWRPEKPDEEPEEPHKLINHMAQEHLAGYRMYGDLDGKGKVVLDNGDFECVFYPETYRDIINNPALKSEERKLTLMFYLCGTDLESRVSSATKDLICALSAQYDLDRLNVLVLAGGTTTWNNPYMRSVNDGVKCCLYYLDPTAIDCDPEDRDFWKDENAGKILTGDAADGSTRGSMRLLASLGQVEMGDPKLLLGFMDTAYDLFPAEYYDLTLWNHGSGAARGICSPAEVSEEENSMYYQGRKLSAEPLTLAKLESALNSSKIYKERGALDILNLDACLMGGIELAYNLSPYVDYMTASEESTYGCKTYRLYYSHFAQDAVITPTPRELAMIASSSYVFDHEPLGSLTSTNAAYDLKALRDYGKRMDRFGKAMSALLGDEATMRDTVNMFYGAACRAVSFGAPIGGDDDKDLGEDYVDMYSLLKGLYGLLWERGQRAYESGQTEIADRYTEAMRSISALYEPKFIVYRGFQSGKEYALMENGTESGNMSIDMSQAEYMNLWKAGGFGHVCGIDMYLPYKTTYGLILDDEETRNYFSEAVFPEYTEFLKAFRKQLQSDWWKERASAAKQANLENPARLFSGIAIQRYNWKDGKGMDRSDIVVRVRFDQDDQEDLVSSFLFKTGDNYRVGVMRHGTVRSRETGETRDADLIIGESSVNYPTTVFISGEISCENREDGSTVVTDTAGLTIDTALLEFIAYYVQGETAETDENTFATDYATRSRSETASVKQFKDITQESNEGMIAMQGTVYFQDAEGRQQSHDADLIFGMTDHVFTYEGAIYTEGGEQDGGDDDDDDDDDGKDSDKKYIVVTPGDTPGAIEFSHYMVENGRKLQVEKAFDMSRPRFIIENGRSAPVIQCIDPSKITPDNDYETEYNKYGLIFENLENRAYVGEGEDDGCVDSEVYGDYSGIGEIVQRDEPPFSRGPGVRLSDDGEGENDGDKLNADVGDIAAEASEKGDPNADPMPAAKSRDAVRRSRDASNRQGRTQYRQRQSRRSERGRR